MLIINFWKNNWKIVFFNDSWDLFSNFICIKYSVNNQINCSKDVSLITGIREYTFFTWKYTSSNFDSVVSQIKLNFILLFQTSRSSWLIYLINNSVKSMVTSLWAIECGMLQKKNYWYQDEMELFIK